jgi:hypothetical protein
MRSLAGAAAAAAAAALLLCLTGCAPGVTVAGSVCLPAPLRVSPVTAAPGDTLLVSSGPADCDLGHGPHHTYRVKLIAPHVSSPPVSVEPAPDGRFSVELPVPGGFPPGDAFIVVTGSPFDHCDDTGSGSCAGYAAPVTIR